MSVEFCTSVLNHCSCRFMSRLASSRRSAVQASASATTMQTGAA